MVTIFEERQIINEVTDLAEEKHTENTICKKCAKEKQKYGVEN